MELEKLSSKRVWGKREKRIDKGGDKQKQRFFKNITGEWSRREISGRYNFHDCNTQYC